MLIPFGILSAAASFGPTRLGVAGYFGGGSTSFSAGSSVATVDKFDFPADTRSTLGTGLSLARTELAGMADSGVAGYFGGGTDGDVRATVDKFAFPADTRTTLGTGLSGARHQVAGMANSGVAGYFAGGLNSAGSSQSTVDKFAFPADTRSTLGTGLSGSRRALGGISNEGVF
jgi:hypothetical protein